MGMASVWHAALIHGTNLPHKRCVSSPIKIKDIRIRAVHARIDCSLTQTQSDAILTAATLMRSAPRRIGSTAKAGVEQNPPFARGAPETNLNAATALFQWVDNQPAMSCHTGLGWVAMTP